MTIVILCEQHENYSLSVFSVYMVYCWAFYWLQICDGHVKEHYAWIMMGVYSRLWLWSMYWVLGPISVCGRSLLFVSQISWPTQLGPAARPGAHVPCLVPPVHVQRSVGAAARDGQMEPYVPDHDETWGCRTRRCPRAGPRPGPGAGSEVGGYTGSVMCSLGTETETQTTTNL